MGLLLSLATVLQLRPLTVKNSMRLLRVLALTGGVPLFCPDDLLSSWSASYRLLNLVLLSNCISASAGGVMPLLRDAKICVVGTVFVEMFVVMVMLMAMVLFMAMVSFVTMVSIVPLLKLDAL
jgi:hypothetical protein